MNNILEWLVTAWDPRQQAKVKHLMRDIIAIVFFAQLAKANEWIEIYLFAVAKETLLRKYLALPHGIPSHDTIQRVFAMVAPGWLQEFRKKWNHIISGGMGEKIRKILALDGKTQCGNGNEEQKANHIVSAVDEEGLCIGEVLVQEKSNEITAIPELLRTLNIKGHIVTTDAMGCQTEIARLIRKGQADYVLSLKGNQGNLHEEVKEYFEDSELLGGCAYHKVVDKARGAVELREYWQTTDIGWLRQGKAWAGLSSIVMTKNTIVKEGEASTSEVRYFISSLALNVEEAARAIRGHWMVESYHWHLDVTFGEDANHTLEKAAAYNLNIVKKMALNTLKLVDVGICRISVKNKRYMISMNFEHYLDILMAL
jgi:predicted transposase YbfD/YdcC